MRSIMISPESIRSFWNRAAEDNPYWYVSSYGTYGPDRNLEEFWASGDMVWKDLKRTTGYAPQKTDTVVEIGCGVGRLTRAIAPDVGQVVAFDISEKMLAIVRSADLPNAEFRLAEGFSLAGVPTGAIDFALAYCVFQHLPTLEALRSYLAEMHRVTKPGGIIAFTLVPRDWTAWLLPPLRVKAYLREHLSLGGPKRLYRKEWVGIRPNSSAVYRVTPIRLEHRMLSGERILYFGHC